MNLELDSKHRQFIEAKVRAGAFRSPEAVVAAGLELLEREEEDLRTVRGRLEEALAQAKRGELLDADEVFDELERRIDAGE